MIVVEFSLCFFFQAEDGIRDLVRSRGLGDVYKRQIMCPYQFTAIVGGISPSMIVEPCFNSHLLISYTAVSYTHLTLPTIYSV